MTIQQQADLIVEKYRPYVHLCLPGNMEDEVETRNAVLCGIKEVEARIEEHVRCAEIFRRVADYGTASKMLKRYDELTAILNELKSRI